MLGGDLIQRGQLFLKIRNDGLRLRNCGRISARFRIGENLLRLCKIFRELLSLTHLGIENGIASRALTTNPARRMETTGLKPHGANSPTSAPALLTSPIS